MPTSGRGKKKAVGEKVEKIPKRILNKFMEVQQLLDQNNILITEIKQNQESKLPENLDRNVGLIRQLYHNINLVNKLYKDTSDSFVKKYSPVVSTDGGGGSCSESGNKRQKPVKNEQS